MANRLSEESIQRIQSFLNGEEAARTTILSKSWYGAYSTRPDLVFKQRRMDEFREITKKTMQRYEDLNLKINSLTLSMYAGTEPSPGHDPAVFLFCPRMYELKSSDDDDVSLAKELMVRAMKLGADDLDITVWNKFYVFPDEVLRSETLATLSLCGSFKIDYANLACSKLKSLTLSMDNVKCDLFRDLIPRFPLLETLKFDGQILTNRHEGEFGNLRLGFRKLKLKFYRLNNCQFKKLGYLYLGNLIVQGDLFADASAFSEFPSLKELVIWDCNGFKDIRICSKSLERISIWLVEERKSYVTEFDVPNIRKFMIEGCGWSGLALETTCTEWESDVRLTYGHPRTEWFVLLDELLKKLKGSKVALTINVTEETGNCSGSVRWGPHVVENLTLDGCVEITPTFLDNFFSICRPKFIIREYYPPRDPLHEYLLELFCKGVVEKVNVELHPWKTVLDHGWKLVRFRLIWGPAPSREE